MQLIYYFSIKPIGDFGTCLSYNKESEYMYMFFFNYFFRALFFISDFAKCSNIVCQFSKEHTLNLSLYVEIEVLLRQKRIIKYLNK